MFRPQRITQQRVVEQVDLPHRQIVRGPPVPVDPGQIHWAQRTPRGRVAHTARWNGAPPHNATGAASAKLRPVPFRTWKAGTVAHSTTGAVKSAQTANRVRSDWIAASRSAVALSESGSESAAIGRGESRRIASRLDLLDELVRCHASRVRHSSAFDRTVHRGEYAFQPVQVLLDPRCARDTRHAGDLEIDPRFAGSRGIDTRFGVAACPRLPPSSPTRRPISVLRPNAAINRNPNPANLAEAFTKPTRSRRR